MTEEQMQEDAETCTDMSKLIDTQKPEQRQVRSESVYQALVATCSHHYSLHGSGKRFADMVAFDLCEHSVFTGHFSLISRGKIVGDKWDTTVTTTSAKGLPWLTEEERTLDPVELFRQYWHSSPTEGDKYRHCNFPACDVDEMSMSDIAGAMPRNEARVRLEAWVLCAAMDGTLAKLVEKAGWTRDKWFWSFNHDGPEDSRLVIRAEWLGVASEEKWTMRKTPDGAVVERNGSEIARLKVDSSTEAARAIEKAHEMLRLLRQLKREAFKLQLITKRYPMAETLQEAEDLIAYVSTGKYPAWIDSKNSK